MDTNVGRVNTRRRIKENQYIRVHTNNLKKHTYFLFLRWKYLKLDLFNYFYIYLYLYYTTNYFNKHVNPKYIINYLIFD